MSTAKFSGGFVCTGNKTIKKIIISFFLALFIGLFSNAAYAQFEVPEFEKITNQSEAEFFRGINLTGRGLYENTELDDRQTNEIRARLQAAFGDPTRTLEDLINKENFRLGQAIQFEYWFTVDDSIPLVVLDWDGPFGNGLTFGGASKYIDLMPQIKRAFVQKLMSVDTLGNYQDYFYSPERKQWFIVKFQDGKFKTTKIESPDGMSID